MTPAVMTTPAAGIERPRDRLDVAGIDDTVVVQEHQRVALRGACRAVDRSAVTEVLVETKHGRAALVWRGAARRAWGLIAFFFLSASIAVFTSRHERPLSRSRITKWLSAGIPRTSTITSWLAFVSAAPVTLRAIAMKDKA